MKKRYWFLVIFVFAVVIFYLYPNPKRDFKSLYTGDEKTILSLEKFREVPLSSITVNDVTWNYIATGKGKETILFLHGLGGAYDIWFQQIETLKKEYRVIAPTYPPVDSFDEIATALLNIIDKEGIDKINIIGSSLGGAITQHFTATHPERVRRAILGNTFPADNSYEKEFKSKITVARYLPNWAMMKMFRTNLAENVIPSSENSALVASYLLEQYYGLMSKQQFLARAECVMTKFNTPNFRALNIPVMIIESDNDPLITKSMRAKLKKTYPTAKVKTLNNKGHFPYLNSTKEYTMYIKDFLNNDRDINKDLSTTIHEYFQGRKEGNTELLKKIFHPTARLQTTKEDTLSSLSLLEYLNHVQTQGVVDCKTTILSAEITGNIATAKTEFDYGTIKYIDYLSLLKVENTWRIVNKTYQKID